MAKVYIAPFQHMVMATHHFTAGVLAALVVALIGIAGILGGGLTSAAVFTGGAFAPLSSEGLLSGILVVLGLAFGYIYLKKRLRSA